MTSIKVMSKLYIYQAKESKAQSSFSDPSVLRLTSCQDRIHLKQVLKL